MKGKLFLIALLFLLPLMVSAGEGAKKGKQAELSGTEPETFFQLLSRGGPLMYPIYAASVIALTFVLERSFALRRKKVLPPAFKKKLWVLTDRRPLDISSVLAFCEANDNPAARIVAAALRRSNRSLSSLEQAIEQAGRRESRRLRRNTGILRAVASITPLIGLLGTVIGMINAFWSLGEADPLRKSVTLASGIWQALLTTAAGLSVAIPTRILYLYFSSKIERIVAELDEVALSFAERITEEKGSVPSWEAKV